MNNTASALLDTNIYEDIYFTGNRYPDPSTSIDNNFQIASMYKGLSMISKLWHSSTNDGGRIIKMNIFIKFLIESSLPKTYDINESESKTETPPQKEHIQWIRRNTGLTMDRIAQLLQVSRQTVYLWERGEDISDTHLHNLILVKDILERAARIYTTPRNLQNWLFSPCTDEGNSPFTLLEQREFDRARFYAMSIQSKQVKKTSEKIKKFDYLKYRHSQEYVSDSSFNSEEDIDIDDLYTENDD